MSEAEAEKAFAKVRWPQTNGAPQPHTRSLGPRRKVADDPSAPLQHVPEGHPCDSRVAGVGPRLILTCANASNPKTISKLASHPDALELSRGAFEARRSPRARRTNSRQRHRRSLPTFAHSKLNTPKIRMMNVPARAAYMPALILSVNGVAAAGHGLNEGDGERVPSTA